MFRTNFPAFTLIELLVVIAVVGVLAGSIIVIVNPSEQLARARDAKRFSDVQVLGKAVLGYQVVKNTFPAASTSWITTVKNTGDIQSEPSNPGGGGSYVQACQQVSMNMNGYCYKTNGTDVLVAARAESLSEITRAACTMFCPGCGIPQVWILWSSAVNKTGLYCTQNWSYDPVPGMTDVR